MQRTICTLKVIQRMSVEWTLHAFDKPTNGDKAEVMSLPKVY